MPKQAPKSSNLMQVISLIGVALAISVVAIVGIAFLSSVQRGGSSSNGAGPLVLPPIPSNRMATSSSAESVVEAFLNESQAVAQKGDWDGYQRFIGQRVGNIVPQMTCSKLKTIKDYRIKGPVGTVKLDSTRSLDSWTADRIHVDAVSDVPVWGRMSIVVLVNRDGPSAGKIQDIEIVSNAGSLR